MADLITPEEVRGNLCWYDPQHPYYLDNEDGRAPREKGCPCDPCFYGRDRLAVALLHYQGIVAGMDADPNAMIKRRTI